MNIACLLDRLKITVLIVFFLGNSTLLYAQNYEKIPNKGWTPTHINSQEIHDKNTTAENAFDDNPLSFWLSQTRNNTLLQNESEAMPHEIEIDLGAEYLLTGFNYQPRQDGEVNGRIAQYEFSVSTDGETWQMAAQGLFANDAEKKQSVFPATSARHIRLTALSEVNGYTQISIAELDILTTRSQLPAPTAQSFSGVYQLTHIDSGKLLTAKNTSFSTNIYLEEDESSTDDSNDEDDVSPAQQQWQLVPVADNNYQLLNVATGKVMSVYDNAIHTGAPVHVAPQINDNDQQWRITTQDGNYQLVHTKSALVLALPSADTEDESSIQLENSSTATSSQWQLQWVGPALMNQKPAIIPSVREWISGAGSWKLSASTRICINPRDFQALSAQAEAFRQDLLDIYSLDLAVTTARPAAGDIYLSLGERDAKIGTQGYILNIGSHISITAKTAGAVMFGTRSVLQALKTNGQQYSILQGRIKDYPQWPSRGFMLDVGRMFFSINYLRDIVKFMSYYKMNEFQIHVNDNKIDFDPNNWRTEPSGFRLKSDTHPGLTSAQHYTKQEYSDLIRLAKIYGVTIITEIDTPAHSLAFTQYRPDLAHSTLKKDHLNLSNPQTAPFIESVWDEYLTIFDQVHIGTDEYNSVTERSIFKRYINRLNRFLRAKGKGIVRMWGSQGSAGGAAGVDKNLLVNIWYEGYYNPVTAIADGYNIINTDHRYYIVPKAKYYNDYLDTKNIYNNWMPNNLPGGTVINVDHPQLKGGMFCVWNDILGKGYNQYGVYDRIKPAMKTFSEKMWRAGTERPYATFNTLMDTVGEAPRTTHLLPRATTGNLAAFRPATASSNEATDLSANKAFDSILSTRWASQYTDNQWIAVDLGAVKKVNHVKLQWEAAFGKQYKIQTSTNGTVWTDVIHESNGNGSLDSHYFNTVNTRHIRMLGMTRATTYGYSIFEFEVYGP